MTRNARYVGDDLPALAHWDADDWFAPAKGDVAQTAADALKGGEEVFVQFVTEEVNEARQDGAVLDEEDAAAVLRRFAEEELARRADDALADGRE